MKKLIGLFVLFIAAIGFALPAYAGKCAPGAVRCQRVLDSQVDLEHPKQSGQDSENLPLELKEFKNVIGSQLPNDLKEIWAESGACAEPNWTPVRTAHSSFGCRVYSNTQGSKWKGVYNRAEGGKGYKLFKLVSYLDKQGKKQQRWDLQVDRQSNGDLYAVNGNGSQNPIAKDEKSETPSIGGIINDALKKGGKLPGGIPIPKF